MTIHAIDLSDLSDEEVESILDSATKEHQKRTELQVKSGMFPAPNVAEVAVFKHHPVKAVDSYRTRARAKGLDIPIMTVVTIMRHAAAQQSEEKKT